MVTVVVCAKIFDSKAKPFSLIGPGPLNNEGSKSVIDQ